MTRLAQPIKGQTYRRRTKDKPLRVIWRDPDTGKERRKAWAWWGPAYDDLRTKQWDDGLLVDVRHDRVASYDFGENKPPWREPTEAEVERILALKLTYESR